MAYTWFTSGFILVDFLFVDVPHLDRHAGSQDVAISITKSPSDQSIGTVDYLVIKVAIEEFSFIDDLPIETLKPIETFF